MLIISNDLCRKTQNKLHYSFCSGFSLIELLVVIAVVALLIGILVPTLARSKERSRRIVCRNHIHQFSLALHAYAANNEGRLPGRPFDSGNTPTLIPSMWKSMIYILGDGSAMMCPSLPEPFSGPDGWFYKDYYVLGYNYLGGHGETPWPVVGIANAEWRSPQSTADRTYLPIITELNAWSTVESKTFAPHGKRGPILEAGDPLNPSVLGIPSKEIGAEGGNIGLLDGSSSWKNIEDMKIYHGSKSDQTIDCFSAW